MWKMIAVPIVGAIIGYITNWVAVKMLFRPHYEKRIGGWRIPFTPGVIPKGQARLARAVGETIEKDLLNAEVMKDMLLSDDMMAKVRTSIDQWMTGKKENETTIRDAALQVMEEDSWNDLLYFADEKGTNYIMDRLMEMNPGKVLTERILEIAKEKLAESMLGMMIGGSFLDSIGEMLEEKINEYLAQEGPVYLESRLQIELNKLQNKTIASLLSGLEEEGISLTDFVLALYEKLVADYITSIMGSISLSTIVENRINSMKVEEVERLVLVIMKKELGAIVNLGALIGFILGLVNVLILML